MSDKKLRWMATLAISLALFVVMLGAYTRLTDAGLGCPDWPGCYGHLVVQTPPEKALQQVLGVEPRKAWTEMAHRYAAGTLALLVLLLAGFSFQRKKPVIAIFLTVMIFFQAALGMWTVTLKLLPMVVMGHLLGGLLIFSGLCYLRWQLSRARGQNLASWRPFITCGLVMVFCQIALGGWVSSNYAGIACIGFPRCNGQWVPALNFSNAFHFFSTIGTNYQGGVLDNDARVTIQFVHRLGAYVTATYVVLLSSLILWRLNDKKLRFVAFMAMGFVTLQFILGVMNVVYLLPLWIAVAHNGVAALLLATMVSLRYLATKGEVYAEK